MGETPLGVQGSTCSTCRLLRRQPAFPRAAGTPAGARLVGGSFFFLGGGGGQRRAAARGASRGPSQTALCQVPHSPRQRLAAVSLTARRQGRGPSQPSPTARRAPPRSLTALTNGPPRAAGVSHKPSPTARRAAPVPAAGGASGVWRDGVRNGFPRLAANPVPARGGEGEQGAGRRWRERKKLPPPHPLGPVSRQAEGGGGLSLPPP